jgi:AcrR family transcriptional regulator
VARVKQQELPDHTPFRLGGHAAPLHGPQPAVHVHVVGQLLLLHARHTHPRGRGAAPFGREGAAGCKQSQQEGEEREEAEQVTHVVRCTESVVEPTVRLTEGQMPESPTRTFSPPSWEKADAAARRRLIVESALALLQRHGAAGVTMRAVAEALGVGTMTLYGYVEGQADLHAAMAQRGFEKLHEKCRRASTLGTQAGWRGGAKAYLRFAEENPDLYRLMFDMPAGEEPDLLEGGLGALLERVRARLAAQKPRRDAETLEREARVAAGRFWIALHGLASLTLAGRAPSLGRTPEAWLEDLLERVAPP